MNPRNVFLVLAVVLFLFAAFGVAGSVEWLAAGLAAWAASMISWR